MIVSTKGRYALRVMVCFAQRGGNEYIPLKEIAESEGISQKYLESIMTTLSKAGFVDAVHGKGGGYRLTREPSDYSVGEIIRAADGSLSCLGANAQLTRCEVSSGLSAVWNQLDERIAACLDAVPLSSLTTADAADEYVI